MAYETLKTGEPVYLHDLLHNHQPARTLEKLQSTTTLSAGDKDQLRIQSTQYHGTSCLKLSVSTLQLQKVPLPSPFSRHIWKLNCSQLHMARSNICSAAGASDSNRQHTAPPINVFDTDTWHYILECWWFLSGCLFVHVTVTKQIKLRWWSLHQPHNPSFWWGMVCQKFRQNHLEWRHQMRVR